MNYYGNMSDDGIGTRFASPQSFGGLGKTKKRPSASVAERADRAKRKLESKVAQAAAQGELLWIGNADRASFAVVGADERVPDDAVVVE